jgi:hypothetical protein
VRHIDFSSQLPAFDSPRWDAKPPFKFFGALGERAADFSHACRRHCLDMTACERQRSLPMGKRLAKPSLLNRWGANELNSGFAKLLAYIDQ